MSRYRRLKIEGGAFFFTLVLADRGGNATELLWRLPPSSAQAALRIFPGLLALPFAPAQWDHATILWKRISCPNRQV
jgi:hypothetical protein